MASFGLKNNYIPLSSKEMNCDECNSNHIIDTKAGYVCSDCGIVLKIKKLEYHRPYNDDILQYAVLGTTQVGTKRERLRSSNSYRLEKLNMLQIIKDNVESVMERARIEVSRIINALNLPTSSKKTIISKLKLIRDGLNPGTKYRNPDKLAPICVYFTMKMLNISINENDLLEVSKISKKEFNAFKLQITNFIPEYSERNRKDYVLQKVQEIRQSFGLGMEFYYQTKSILYKLWGHISCTKDDVIAGVACSITTLCCLNEEERKGINLTVNGICKILGIKMSTIQSQIKKRIFEKFKIPNFTTLIRSTDMLKKFLIKIKLLKSNKTPKYEVIPVIGFKKIVLKGEARVFCRENEGEYYSFLLTDIDGYPLNLEIIPNKYREIIDDIDQKTTSDGLELVFKCNVKWFYVHKGPP